MASTSEKFNAIQLHGCGVANSGNYPDICVALEITFTRSSSSSKTVNWSASGVDISTGYSNGDYFNYPFYCDISVGGNTKWLVSKDWTSGTGWRSSVSLHDDGLSGSFTSTSSSVTVKFLVKAGYCMNDGNYCYGESGDYTVYSRSVKIPSYSSGSSGGGGGGKKSTTYQVIYDAGLGTGAPDPQNITSGQALKLSTKEPTLPMDVRFYNYPDGGSFGASDFTSNKIVSRRFRYWQSYSAKADQLNWSGPCDGEHYTYPRHIVESKNINYAYALPYGVKEVFGNSIYLIVNSGLTIPLYHWRSNKAPKDSRYPYYYAIEPYTLPGQAYFVGDCITIGTLSNAPTGVWHPTPPPKGTKLLINYIGERNAYADTHAGPIYYPGDTFDTSGSNANHDTYLSAVWDTGIATMDPMPESYRTVNFDFNGGTGSPASKVVPREKLGYAMWDYRRQVIEPERSRVYYRANEKYDIDPAENQVESNPTVHVESFSGDGERLEFSLEAPCLDVRSLTVDGEKKREGTDFTFGNFTLTFTEPPAEGENNIEIYYDALDMGHREHFTSDGKGNMFTVDYRCDYLYQVKIDGVIQDLSHCSIEENGTMVYVGTTPAEGTPVDIQYTTYTSSVQTFTGDGTTKKFSTRHIIRLVDYVKLDGVIQDSETYTTSDLDLTFTQAPASGAAIEIKYYTIYIFTDWGCQSRMVSFWGNAVLPYDQIPIPDKPGFVLKGWFYDDAFTNPVIPEDGVIVPLKDASGQVVKEITIYAKWLELPIHQFGSDGRWHPLEPHVWQFGEDNQWHKVAHVYKFVKDEGEEEGHWEDVSGMLS